ncbi:MAG: LPS export ABC transporter periplasmic protein LptC, partial [Desulfobacterales bacterium]|nr:LPS export ABC transporter periplasmic protein LptC [Desulfobacterales bacterium]
RSENLHYKHESRIIYTDTPLTVIGPESRFKADSGRFEIKSNKLILKGHVQTWIAQNEKSQRSNDE